MSTEGLLREVPPLNTVVLPSQALMLQIIRYFSAHTRLFAIQIPLKLLLPLLPASLVHITHILLVKFGLTSMVYKPRRLQASPMTEVLRQSLLTLSHLR